MVTALSLFILDSRSYVILSNSGMIMAVGKPDNFVYVFPSFTAISGLYSFCSICQFM